MSTAEQNRKPWHNWLVLGSVILLFLAPLVFAWYVARDYQPGTGGGSEHGILINPPRALENLQIIDPVAGRKTALHGKWTMFAIFNGECGKECKDVMYRMRQIHLAMGEKLFRVQRAVYFTGPDSEAHAKNIFPGYEGQLLLTRNRAGTGFLNNFLMEDNNTDYAIYLIDPRGFLMMCYPGDTSPGGIIKDLKRLLKTVG